MPSKIRKGGESRWVLTGLQQGDSFTVPRGHNIRSMVAETVAVNQIHTITVSGTLSAGTADVRITPSGGTLVTFTGLLNGSKTAAATVAQMLTSTYAAQVASLAAQGYALSVITNTSTTAATVVLQGAFSSVKTGVVVSITTGYTQTWAGAVTGGTASISTVPTLAIGATPPVAEVQTIPIAGTASTTAPTVVTIGGADFLGAGLAIGDTPSTSVTKLLAYTAGVVALQQAGWYLTGNASTGTLTLTATSPASNASLVTTVTTTQAGLTYAGGATSGTATRAISGSRPTEFMTATSSTVTTNTLTSLTSSIASGKAYTIPANVSTYTLTFSGSSITAGTLFINGNQYTLASAPSTSSALATAVAALNVPGFTLVASSSTVVFTQVATGAGWDIPTFVFGTITGTSLTAGITSSTPADNVYYISTSSSTIGTNPLLGTLPNGYGRYNLYILMEKWN